MNNDKAIATATAMVAVSALATGALYFGSQAGAGEPEPVSPTIVVEQIDAAGDPVADVAPDPSFDEPDGYQEDDEYDEYDEYDDHEDDEYEDDEYDEYDDHEDEGSH